MEANVKIQSADKSPENWQMLAEMLKNVRCNYARLQLINEGFLVFLKTSEYISLFTANVITGDLSSNAFNVVVPQKIVSKKM